MEYIYYLEGLGCANCAAKMEKAIGEHKDVKCANVVYMKKKLIVEPKKDMTDALLKDIEKMVQGIENHVVILPYDEKDSVRVSGKKEYSGKDGCGHDHGHTGSGHDHDDTDCTHEHGHDDADCRHEHGHDDTGCTRDHGHDDADCSHDHKHSYPDTGHIYDHGHRHNHADLQHIHNHGHNHGNAGTDRRNQICMAVGLSLFVAALLLDKFSLVSAGIYVAFYVLAYILIAYDVLWQSLQHIRAGQVFDEFFLMSVATLGALVMGEFPEAVAVMLFYKIGEHFQDKAVDQARGSIESLVNIKPDFAGVLLPDGNVVRKSPEEVSVGDVIAVKAGERVPLDGVLMEGSTSLNMAALTGEAKPVDVSVGDKVLSGSINMTGYIRIKVEKTFQDSTVARIMDMVENAADKKSKAEQFITKFARIYTPIVCFLALGLAVLPPVFGAGNWSTWMYRALSFLVVSCPCALVISVPLGFFGGIGVASKNGILVKGGNYLEALADISVIAFDKTGTLTKGSFKVNQIHADEKGIQEVKSLINGKLSEEDLDEISGMDQDTFLLYLLSLAEAKSNHPIGRSVLNAYGKEIIPEHIISFEEAAGYGLVVDTIYGQILAGNEKMMQKYGITYGKSDSAATVVYGAVDHIYIGAVVIADEMKQDTRQGIADLAKEGIAHTVLLSGDRTELVSEVAREIGIEIAFGELLPGDKLGKIEELYEQNPENKIAYVGDGINDAPVLARVDVGIAMGGIGQDAAIEAADIVLMTDEVGKIAQAVGISKYTRQIVTENILLALGIKVLVLLLIAIGYSSMWMAVFADVGVALLAVCNSIRVYKHDFS